MANKHIRLARLSFEETYAILLDGDKDFYCPVSSEVDFVQYAHKLSEYALFLLLEIEQQVVGCIAYYLNEEGRYVYISHFWVSCKWQRHRFGTQMLNELMSLYGNSFREIFLEVNKESPAFLFYQRNGFSVVDDHGKKYLLTLPLRQYE